MSCDNVRGPSMEDVATLERLPARGAIAIHGQKANWAAIILLLSIRHDHASRVRCAPEILAAPEQIETTPGERKWGRGYGDV